MSKHIILALNFFILLLILAACSEKREPTAVSPHPVEWADTSSASFHGKLVLDGVLGTEGCQSCHGEDLQGKNSAPGCNIQGCHNIYPHPDGWADSLSDNFHGSFVAQTLSWNIHGCQSCHGSNYKGAGYDSKNCTKCHEQPQGPEACNTCHGSSVNFAPPKDLNGHIATTFIGVGAHQAHLQDTTLTTAFTRDCNLCHIQPATYSDIGHIDGSLPAEVVFNEFAADSGKTHPVWDNQSASCANVYCHGSFAFSKDKSTFQWIYTDFVIVGNNRQMIWNNVDAGQAACGTCHDLPPKGHAAHNTCDACHGKVVDANFNIINKKLHINGKIDVF